jgi:hypothetical protein
MALELAANRAVEQVPNLLYSGFVTCVIEREFVGQVPNLLYSGFVTCVIDREFVGQVGNLPYKLAEEKI